MRVMIYMVVMAMCDLCGPQIGLASSGGTLRNQILDGRGCFVDIPYGSLVFGGSVQVVI